MSETINNGTDTNSQPAVNPAETNWVESKAGFTPEMKAAFSKYKTEDEAFKGGYEAMKSYGKSYKLPESLGKLPDDKTKEEFMSGIEKLLGSVNDEKDLADFDFAAGIGEGGKVNDVIAGKFKDFILNKKMPKSLAQDAVKFYNEMGEEFKAMQERQFLDEAAKCDETLISDPKIGSKEKMAELDELTKRMFKNNLGLSNEEYEQAALQLANANFTRQPVLRKALYAAAELLAKEGKTSIGEGGNPPPKVEVADKDRPLKEILPLSSKIFPDNA